MQAATHKLLKNDVFGRVTLRPNGAGLCVLRETQGARRWACAIARWLLAREARALQALAGIEGVPQLISADCSSLCRSYIDGQPMQNGNPSDPAYFRAARRLLHRLHRLGVAHNDLAKEPNWLVTSDGSPALIDFQLAAVRPRRGFMFRQMAREDLRHLLKHKRTYCPEALTRRELDMLERPSVVARSWALSGKKLYLLVTRRLLNWSDREGAGDRSSHSGT